MGIATKRKNIDQGGSTLVSIPAALQKGRITTMAADRIILADPRGVIHEKELLEFLEKYVEPKLWDWLAEKNRGNGEDAATATKVKVTGETGLQQTEPA